jgi:signal transduction histidine kinase
MVETTAKDLLDRLFGISRLLAGQLDFRSAIQAIAQEIMPILPHDHLDVCIVLPDGQFHTAYESGFETDWSKQPSAPVEDSPIRALLRAEVDHMITADACTDPRFANNSASYAPIRDHGLRSRLHVPMMVQGQVIGAFSASLCRADSYDATDMRNARYIADLLSPYFFALRAAEQAKQSAIVEAEARVREEGLRLGALKLTEALELERQRIGMDLHDQTLADMTRLTRHLDRLAQSEAISGQMLEPVAHGLHSCIDDLRQIIEQAKPSLLQLFGFTAAIEHHLSRSIRESGQPINWTLSDESDGAFDRLAPNVSIALFRIAQEAMNNAVAHSSAARISVLLGASRDQVTLVVGDDGKGIAKLRTRVGSGIDNMKTRARLISARCALSSDTAGSGTLVTISLPISSEAGKADPHPLARKKIA